MKIKVNSYNESVIEIDDKKLKNMNKYERDNFIGNVAEWN